MTEWARTNDEWNRVRSVIDSPSRGFEYLGNPDKDKKDKLAVFASGMTTLAVEFSQHCQSTDAACSSVLYKNYQSVYFS